PTLLAVCLVHRLEFGPSPQIMMDLSRVLSARTSILLHRITAKTSSSLQGLEQTLRIHSCRQKRFRALTERIQTACSTLMFICLASLYLLTRSQQIRSPMP